LVDLKHRVVRADGLLCRRCEGPVCFITPYYGKDEYDLDKQFVGIRTWWSFVPIVPLISAFRGLTGNTRGAKEKLYYCGQCDVDLSFKETTGTSS
jgi:hypothetical protein